MNDISPELQSWNDVEDAASWDALLLGNGASMAVWSKFGYTSLFDIATSEAVDHPLGDTEKNLFAALDSVNFEQVLGALSIARRVNHSFDVQAPQLDEAYEYIKRALIGAVRHVHVPWTSVPLDTLIAVRRALKRFNHVFSLNYDLLVYWAMMAEEPLEDFKDYFWTGTFDITDTDVWGKATRVLWLHGGLHLCRDTWGRTHKRMAQGPGANLLETFGQDFPEATPLFVTEGTHVQKLRTVMSSDYLSFGYHELSSHVGPLVVFGSALGDEDRHIVESINHNGRMVAVSLMPGDGETVKAKKAAVLQNLPRPDVRFFDATTYPLGLPGLAVPTQG